MAGLSVITLFVICACRSILKNLPALTPASGTLNLFLFVLWIKTNSVPQCRTEVEIIHVNTPPFTKKGDESLIGQSFISRGQYSFRLDDNTIKCFDWIIDRIVAINLTCNFLRLKLLCQ